MDRTRWITWASSLLITTVTSWTGISFNSFITALSEAPCNFGMMESQLMHIIVTSGNFWHAAIKRSSRVSAAGATSDDANEGFKFIKENFLTSRTCFFSDRSSLRRWVFDFWNGNLPFHFTHSFANEAEILVLLLRQQSGVVKSLFHGLLCSSNLIATMKKWLSSFFGSPDADNGLVQQLNNVLLRSRGDDPEFHAFLDAMVQLETFRALVASRPASDRATLRQRVWYLSLSLSFPDFVIHHLVLLMLHIWSS